MKNFIIGAGLLISATFSGQLLAESPSVTPGKILYIVDDQVVERDVTLSMERLNADTASFTLSAGDWSVESSNAWMNEKRGANYAFIGFKNAWSMQGEASHLLFKGVKLKGENRVVYQGSLFKMKDSKLRQSGESFEECLAKIEATGKIDDKWSFAGSFSFDRNLMVVQ